MYAVLVSGGPSEYTHQFRGCLEVSCCFWDGVTGCGWTTQVESYPELPRTEWVKKLRVTTVPPLSCDCDEGNELSYVKPKDHTHTYIYIYVYNVYIFIYLDFCYCFLQSPFTEIRWRLFFSHVKLSQQKLITNHSNVRVLLPRFYRIQDKFAWIPVRFIGFGLSIGVSQVFESHFFCKTRLMKNLFAVYLRYT